MYALEKAKDLYDEVINDDGGAIRAEIANKLTYITKSLNDLAFAMENVRDDEFNDHVKMIIKEAIEENGFNNFG